MRDPDVVKTEQDLTDLLWHTSAAIPGTSGSFPKATRGNGTGTVYYKASCYDAFNGFFGHECVNELVASRLMGLLGVPHVHYALIKARVLIDKKEHVTWVNASSSYRHTSETKQSFAQFYQQCKNPGETPLDLCDRMGWDRYVRQMMLIDYLIINQDRHGGNVEVLHRANGSTRMAPVFDCGNSLVFSSYDVESAIRKFDPLVDAIGTNFIGSKRLAENLKLIPQGITESLRVDHKKQLLANLDEVLPAYHLEKIWDIIWERWCFYADV